MAFSEYFNFKNLKLHPKILFVFLDQAEEDEDSGSDEDVENDEAEEEDENDEVENDKAEQKGKYCDVEQQNYYLQRDDT